MYTRYLYIIYNTTITFIIIYTRMQVLPRSQWTAATDVSKRIIVINVCIIFIRVSSICCDAASAAVVSLSSNWHLNGLKLRSVCVCIRELASMCLCVCVLVGVLRSIADHRYNRLRLIYPKRKPVHSPPTPPPISLWRTSLLLNATSRRHCDHHNILLDLDTDGCDVDTNDTMQIWLGHNII